MAARFDSDDGGPGGAASTAPFSLDARVALGDAPLSLPTGVDGTLPERFLLDARYARDGLDLVMQASGGLTDSGEPATLRLVGYFDGAASALEDAAGRVLQGSVVSALAGPRASAQLAQADAAGADAALGPVIGTVTETTGTVVVVRADGRTVAAEAGLPVYQDDQVETAPGGAVGMRFEDGSTFSLGADARVVLDALIYDPGADSSMTLNLVKGSFSFVSGQIAKSGDENMQINTPVATIGVRGTAGAGDENEVVLLPEEGPDGQPQLGEISFRTQGGETILNQPYQGTSANSPFDAPSTPQTFTDTDVADRFGDALGFLPSDIPANRTLRQNRQRDESGGEDGGGPGDEGGEGAAPEGEAEADGAGGEAGGEGDGEEEPEAEAEEEAPEEDEPEEGDDPEADEADAGDLEDDPEGFGAAEGEGDPQTQLAAATGDGQDGGEPADQQQDGQPDPDAQEATEDGDPEDLVDDIDFGEAGAESPEGVDQGGDQGGDQDGPQTGDGSPTQTAGSGATAGPGGASGTNTNTSVSGAGGGVSGNAGGGVSGEGAAKSGGDGASATVSGGGEGGGSGGTSAGGGAGDPDESGATLLGEADEELLDEERDDGALAGDGDGESASAPIIATGSTGSDTMVGAGGDDSLDGGAGNDQLFGGAGADNLTGGAGNDVVSGGSGGDTIVGGSGEGDDIYVGGDMTTAGGEVTALGADDSADDAVVYTSATQGVTVNLGDGSAVFNLAGATTAALTDLLGGSLSLSQFGGAYGPQTGTDALYGVEHIESGVGDDHLTGDGAANSITAGDGADYIDGAGAFDRQSGSPGADVIDAGAGDDTVLYDTAYASVSGASFDGGAGVDRLRIGAYQAADLSDIAAQASNFEIIELQDGDSSLAIDSASVESLVGAGGTLTVTGADGFANFDAEIWSASETGEESDGTAFALLSDGTTTVRVTGGVSIPGINLPPSYASVQGDALRFDASLDQVHGPDALIQSDDVTLEAWIEWDGTFTEANQVVVYNGDAGPGDGFGLALIASGSGYNVGGLVDGSTVMLSNASVSADAPTHIALVRESGVFTLYVDGRAEPITNPTAAPSTPTSAFAIGGLPLTSALHFTGAIDDVRVWSVARSQAQIDAARSVHLSGAEDGLFAWYPIVGAAGVADRTDGSTLTVSGVDFETSSAPVASFAAQEDGSFVLSLGVFTDPDADGEGEASEPPLGQEGGEGGGALQPPNSSVLTLSVSDGVLSVNTGIAGGVGLLGASGGGTSTLTLSATLAEINTTLRSGGITFTPSADRSGQSVLTLAFTDADLTNPQTITQTLTIDVAAVADAPFFSLTPSFSGHPGAPITISPLASSQDADFSETLQLTITGVPTGGAFNVGSDLGGGTFVVDEGDFSSLAYIPPVDSLDTATLSFTLSVTDGEDVRTTVATTSISLSLIDIAFDNDFETGDLLTAENWAGDIQPGQAYNAQIPDEQSGRLTTGQSLTLGAMDLGAGTMSMDGGLLQINGALTTEGDGFGAFGALDLSGGTLALGGGALDGPFTWTGGALTGTGTLATASTLTIRDGGSNEAGALDVSGTVTLDSVIEIESGFNHALQGGARLLGDGALRVGGTLALAEGVSIAPSFDILSGGRAAFIASGATGPALDLLGGGSNAGVLYLAGANSNPGSQSPTLVVGDGESFTNLSGGVVQTGGDSAQDVYAFRGAFVNQGTWDVNARARFEDGSGVTLVSLDNTQGTIDVASGSALSFDDGSVLRLGSLSALNGSGTIGFDSGQATIALDEDFTWTASSLKLDISSASVTVSGPGDFVNQSALTIAAETGDVFDARFVNMPGGVLVFDSFSSNQLVEFNGGIDNHWLMRLDGGSASPGSQAVTLAIGDGESLTVRSGGRLVTTSAQSGDVAKIRGDIDLLGELDVNGHAAIEAVSVSSAVLDAENGTIDVLSGRTLTIEDGAVLQVGTGATLSGGGVLALQGPGTVMELVSDFTWTATSLDLDIGGTNASTGQVTIGGAGDFYNTGALTIAQEDDVFAVDVFNATGATLAFVNSADTGPDVRFTEGLQNDGLLKLGGANSNPSSQAATLTVDAGVTLQNNGVIEFSTNSQDDLHTIRGDVHHLGQLNVLGSGRFQAGGASASVMDSENGAILIQSGRTLTMENGVTLKLGSGSTISGAGTLAFDGSGAGIDVASDFTWTSSDTKLDLTQTSVTVAGEGSFTNAGRLTLQPDSDVFDTGFVNAAGGTLVFNSSTVTGPDLTLNQGLVNQGLITLTGGSTNPGSQTTTLSVAEGQTLTNAAGAIIETTSTSSQDRHKIEGDLLNLGTLQVGGLTALEAGATTQGLLDTENGTITVGSGRTLEIGGDSVLRVGTGSTLDGFGTIQFTSSSASLDVASDFTWSSTNLALDVTQARVTIGGTGTFSVDGDLTMAADDDAFATDLAVLSGGTLTFTNATATNPTVSLLDGGLNAGLIVLAGGNANPGTQAPTMVVADGQTFTNLAGGVFRSAHGDSAQDVASVEGTFVNLGTLEVNAALEFDQVGTVLDTRDGTVTVASGDVLRIDDGALMQVGAGTVLDGLGTIRFVEASRTLEVVEDFTWTASDLALDLTQTNVTITGAGTTFTNAGTLTLAVGGDDLALDFVNASGASLELTSSSATSASALDVLDAFTNAGQLTITGGHSNPGNQAVTIDVASGVTFTNAGGATLRIDHANASQDEVELRGTYVNNGTVEIAGRTEIEDSFTNAGVLSIEAGRTLTVDGGTLINSGTLQGEGTISFVNGATFDNQGTIDVGGGAVGSLTILGDGLDLSDETLILNIANTGSFDQLDVTSLDLTGSETLELSFQNPGAALGTYRIVTYDSHDTQSAGVFETVTSNLDSALYDASLVYQADGIDLLVRAKPQLSGAADLSAREDEGVAITGLSVSDADAGGSEVLTFDLTVDAGTLALTDNAASGATIVTDDAGAVRLTGTITQLNSFLGAANAVRFNPAADASGAVTLTLTLTDGDGVQSTTTQTVTVSPVDDGASASLSYLTFDGADDYLDAGDAAAFDQTGAMTLEVRANMETAPGAGDLATLASKWGAYGERAYWFGVDGDTGQLKLILSPDGGATERTFLSGETLAAGQWAHVGVTVDPDDDAVRFYVDGAPVGTPQSFTDAGAYGGASRFLIGANQGSGAAPVHHFDGGIAEVRLWSAARSAEAIAQKHNQLLQAGESDLAGYWLLNGLNDGAVADRSANSNAALAQHGPAPDPGSAYLSFDGVDDVIDLPSSATGIRTGTGAFTWEGWVRADVSDVGGEPTLMMIGGPATGQRGNLRIDSDGNLSFVSYNQENLEATSADSVATGAWTHVAVTYDGSQVQLYVDGVASGAAQTVGLDITGGDATIGAAVDNAKYFEGDLAEFRVWSEAKSASDLAAFKDGRLTGEEANLEGWWPLDEGVDASVFDRSGAGSHGTVDGATWRNAAGGPPFAPGEAALSLDGVDDRVNLGADAALFSGTTSFTLESWIKIDAAAIASKNAQIFTLGADAAGERADLRVDQTTGELHFTTYGLSPATKSGVSVADGTWKHIAAVYDAAAQTMQLYVDGAAAGAAVSYAAKPPDISAGVAYLGPPAGASSFFEGSVSEARIWSGARSAAEIDGARLSRLSGAEEGLVGYWPLNDGAGTAAASLAPGGSDATLEGGAGWTEVADSAPGVADSGGPNVGAATADASESEEPGTFYLPEDQTLSGVMSSADVEGTPTYAISGETSNDGSFSIRSTELGEARINITTGEWTYTPDPDQTGPDDFTIQVTGATSGTDSQQITIELDPVADAPQLGATHGKALSMAAGEDIVVPNDPGLEPGAGSFTVEAWVNLSTVAADGDQYEYIVSKGNITSGEAGWSISSIGNQLFVRVNGNDGFSQRASQRIPDVSDLEGWHHVALVVDRDANELRGYLNGSNDRWVDGGAGPSSNSIAGFDPIDSTTDMLIGGVRNGSNATETSFSHVGQVDEVRLWSTARTPEQLASFSQLRLNGPEDGLIAAYDFEDPNNLGLDVTGNGYDGALTGSPGQVDSGAPAGGFDIEEDAGSVALTGITVADPDTDGDITVVMEVERGTLTIDDSVSGGIGASGIVGNGTAKLILSGTASAVATTLAAANGLLYAAAANASGLERLQVTANDGQGISTRSYDIAIDAVDDAMTGAGGALQFDGVDDFAEAAELSAFDGATSLTLEGWINTSRPGGTILQLTGNDSLELKLDGAGALELSGTLGDGGSVVGATAINTGEWVHVAAVLEGGQAQLYVNGEAAGSGSVSANLADPDLLIGKTQFGGDYFRGAMDEIRLWTTARSEAEIQGAYQRQLTGDEAGLAAYYRFDERLIEELTDSSGNGNTARLGGVDRSASGDAAASRLNDLNGALSFDGTGEVEIAHDPALSPASFTVETWVRADNGTRSADQRLLISPDSFNEATAYALTLNNGAPSFTVSGGASGAEVVTIGHGASVDDGLWRHVAGVYDGATGTVSFYVNGELSGTGQLTGALLTSTDALKLGADGFVGDLAETRLWNVARSRQEIQDSFELAARGDESGLVALWRGVEDPDDGGSSLTDFAGGHDGTIVGGVSFIDPMAPIEGPAGGTLEVEALEGRTVTGVANPGDVGAPVSFAITSAGAITTDGDWREQSLSAGVLRLNSVTGEWVFEAGYDVTGPQSFEITAIGDDGRTDAQTVSVTVQDFDFDPQVQGGALSFDGSSLIDVGRGVGDSLAITGDLTLEMWVNPTSLDGGRLLSFHSGTGDGESENALYTLFVGSGGVLTFSSETGDGTNHDVAFQDASLESGAWRHVSVVRDTAAQELRLYIDGQLADAVDYAITPTGGEDSRLVIGANTPEGGNYFNGFMDEVRVWSEARSAAQVESAWDRQIANPTGESALQAYWRADDRDGLQLTDASADGNHAALGGVAFTDVASRTLKFDGQNDYAERDSVVLNTASPYTVQTRFKWDGSDSLADMFLAYNGTFDQAGQTGGAGFGLGLVKTGPSSFQIGAFGGDGAIATGPPVVAGRWYDVAVTNDGGTLRLYVDGAERAAMNAPPGNPPAGEFLVGAALTPGGPGGHFAGEIEEVAVWSDVRTADEVAADAAGPISPGAADLAAYYRADAATSQAVTDLTGGTALTLDGARLENDPGPQVEGAHVVVTADRLAAGTFQTHEIEGDGTFAVAGGTTAAGLNSLNEAGKGTLRIDPDSGGWIFEPATGFAGEVSFTVTATGSLSGSDSETLTFQVLPPAVDQTPPNVAGARLAFDGGDVAVTAADPVLAHTDNLTIDLAVKPVALPGVGQSQTLLSHTGDGTGDGANTLYSLVISQNGEIVYTHQTTGGVAASHSFTGAALTEGAWAQLSLVRDISDSTVELFKDGVSVGSYDYSGVGAPADGADGRLLLGAADGAGTDGFIGEMDEVRLYSAVRTDDEIAYYADRQAPAADGDLLVYYRGETTADGLLDDVSGHGRDAVLGAPGGADSLAPRSIEPPARALSFDGTNDYLSVASDAALDPASFTIEAWYRTESTGSRLRILTRSDDNSSFNRYGLRLENGEPTFSIGFEGGSVSGEALTAAGVVNDGLWRHIAGSYDAATGLMRLYVDGELAAEKSVDGTLLSTTSPLFIGAYDERTLVADQRWDGDLADVRLWSEARGLDDIRASMNERLAGDESGLAAWWPLDDGAAGDTPASFADAAGSNDASPTGAPAIVETAPEIGGGLVATEENQTASGYWDASGMVEGSVTYGIEGATVANGLATLSTANGTATVDVSSGAWSFTPGAGFAGTDGFTLTAAGATSGAVRQAMTVEVEETPAEFAAGGDALSFGGGADSVAAPAVTGLSSGALTVELWLNPAETANASTYPISYAAGAESDAFGIVLDDTAGPRFYLNFGGGPNAGAYFDAGVDQLTPGEWAHLAVTWDQATGATAFYVNGVKTAEGTYQTGEALGAGGTLVLGQDQDSVGGGFQPGEAYRGLMDEVRVWSAARSAEQIAASYDAQVATDAADLVAYYRADGYNGGNLLDGAANGNDASVSGAAVLAPPASAADFDRSTADSHIAIDVGGAASALDLTERVSVEAWVKPADLAADQAIFSKFDGASGFELGLDTAGRVTFSGSDGSNTASVASGGSLSLGAQQWAHVAAVFDGGTVHFFIDGEAAGSAVMQDDGDITALATNTLDALIGARADAGIVREFDGAIGEVRVWSDARSADEIFAHRDRSIADPAGEAELAGYWRLDDVAGGGPRDLAGSLDGLVQNAVSAVAGAAPITGSVITLVEGEAYAGRFTAEVGGAATYSLDGGTIEGAYSVLTLIEGVARIHQQTGAFTFTPAANYAGTATNLFTLQATGAGGASQSVQITAAVEAAPTLEINAAGSSLRFDGDDSVTLADAPANDIAAGQDFTLEAWVYRQGSGVQTLIEKGDADGASGGFSLGLDVINRPQFRIGDGGSSVSVSRTDFVGLPENEWSHVAVSVDRSGLATLYLNGVDIGSGNIAGYGSAGLATGDLVFGDGFDGLLDEVRLWTKARSADEIQADYQRQLSGGEADLAGYWRLDDAVDDGMADATGANADASVSGAAAVRFLGRAAEFTGAADEEFSNPGAFDPGAGDLSVSAWVRLDDVNSAQTIVGKGDPDGAGGWSIELDGTGYLVVSVGDGSTEISQRVDVSGLDGWRHVGFTFERGATDSTVRGYLDGAAGGWASPPDGFDTAPSNLLASPLTSSARFAVGAQHDGSSYSQRLDGAVDELRIYNASRTAADMAADMSAATANPAAASGLIGYFGFEEQSGAALDASAGNADLTAGAAAQRSDAAPALSGTLFMVDEDQILSGVLESDSADATPYSQGDGPDHGALEFDAASGRWTYDPDPSYTGEDSFSFQATDSSGNVTEKKITVTVEGAGGVA
ncbi:MAG: LamG-like jellyroll fold domain-containing protein [Marivibrio sp.]|uniref:LamG-like jellyroll fold domain-containing protein n=1 Tax=Marivibrio sp. TaxID=2039719 RepID=UPI0032EE2435